MYIYTYIYTHTHVNSSASVGQARPPCHNALTPSIKTCMGRFFPYHPVPKVPFNNSTSTGTPDLGNASSTVVVLLLF